MRLPEDVEIEIHTGNTAFDDNPNELRLILAQAELAIVELSGKASLTERRKDLYDSSGNKCGHVRVFL